MASKVYGPVAYQLTTGNDHPLTDGQADALIAEYAKLGMRFKKSVWAGNTCIIVRASAEQYECFKVKLSQCWREIHSRVGIVLLASHSNTYEPGRTSFLPAKDWPDVVAFIEANYRQEDQQEEQKRMEVQASRKAAHQCVLCGLALGFLTRVLGKDHHKHCTTFKYSAFQADQDGTGQDDYIPGLIHDGEISALIHLAQDDSE